MRGFKFGERRYPSRNDTDQEKQVARDFYDFLERNNLKQDMPKSELRSIYGSFLLKYSTTDVPRFPRVFNALQYHLNLCQILRSKVVFGGGDSAALQLFGDQSDDDDDDDDDDHNNDDTFFDDSEDYMRSSYCKTCKREFPNHRAYQDHLKTVKHRQQVILRKIRKSLEKPELVRDKHGIEVTSEPAGDDNGVIELQVRRGRTGQIILSVQNTSFDNVQLKYITLLWSVNFFDYRDITDITPLRGHLNPGDEKTFTIGCRRRQEYGYSYVPGVLTFEKEGDEFHIIRFLSVRIVSDLFDDLKATSQYRPPTRPAAIPLYVHTIAGVPPPRLNDGLQVLEKPDKYEIPPTIEAQITSGKKVREGLKERLTKELNFDTYKEKFETLLYIEELQMQRDIRNYDMKGVPLDQDTADRRLLILKVPGLAENRPSVLRGDIIYAYEQGVVHRRYEGIVHKVQMLDVKLGFDMTVMPYVKGKKFDIQFTFNRLPIQFEHRACANSVKRVNMCHVLFPKEESLDLRGEMNYTVRTFFDRKLNEEQKAAVRKILSGSSRPAPYLVFGPPGTGKTVTIVEAIKQVHTQIAGSFILACAPENSAADLLAERLLGHVDQGKLFRMYASSRQWEFVPQTLKDAGVVNFDRVRGEVFYPSKEELMRSYRVIVTTLVTAGRLVSASFSRNHFTHIFVDEAGHAVEPECIIPVGDLLDPNHPRGGQLVLAGDPMQLGPILRSPITQKFGLETSYLERLMTSYSTYERDDEGEYNSEMMTKLINNYRSHRDIIEIPRELFYDDELNECAGDFRNVMLGWEELPNPNFPIVFHPVFGKDEREENSPSFFNVAEVETIASYLKKLLDDNERSRKLKHLKPEMVGIISPYKRQVQKIQTMIEKRRFPAGIKVGSVEEFQGQERRVIIISTVRSTKKEYLEMDRDLHLGFLNNPKRFNVAVTRAQALLILIGNPEMLRKDMSGSWTRFLDYCKKNHGQVDVERKDTVEDIADTLQRLRLLTPGAAGAHEEESEVSQRQLQEHPEWTRHE